MKALANNTSEVGTQGPEASILSRAVADYRDDSKKHPRHLVARLAFILGATAVLLILRWMDPVIAGRWLPFHTSCGAITGLPCIFCGMTRALHLLLNGDFDGALYFNWLAFPFLGAVVFLVTVCVIEIASPRVILTWNTSAPLTARKLTIIGLTLF